MKCMSEKCGKEFKAEPHDDVLLGALVVVCPMCGAKHVKVEDLSLPGGPLQLRFELYRESAKGANGPSSGGGYDHGNG